jgi:hypothetical protein
VNSNAAALDRGAHASIDLPPASSAASVQSKIHIHSQDSTKEERILHSVGTSTKTVLIACTPSIVVINGTTHSVSVKEEDAQAIKGLASTGVRV